MLENLDKIDWSKLEHAYGSATDVPKLVRQLTSRDRSVRDATYEKLYSNIYHQGTLYRATPYVVPFFLELLQEPQIEDKVSLLQFLISVAEASSYNPAQESLSMLYYWSRPSEHNQQQISQMYHVQEAFVAVLEGLPIYYGLLSHEQAQMRYYAVRILANFDEHASTITSLLLQHLKLENNSQVKAMILWCLGCLTPATSPTITTLEKFVLDDTEETPLREVAAISLTYIVGYKTPPEAIKLIIESVRKGLTTSDCFYEDVFNIGTVCEVLYRLGIEAGIEPLTQCLQANTDTDYAISIAETLLDLTFSEKRENLSELNDWQRQALTAIVDCDVLWEMETNLYEIYRLPVEREKLRELLS
jgi:hypothetical protein